MTDIFGNVRKIIKFSAVDGPGNRSVIFLQGCNFNCVYCHNPETIDFNSNEVKVMTTKEIMNELGSAKKFIRGITVSGGECTIQRNFLVEICKEAKSEGLEVFLDSNGSYDFSKDTELMNVIDSVMLDIKSIDSEEHLKITSASNEKVLKNLKFLADNNKLFEIRTVISPSFLCVKKTVYEASKFIAPYGNIRYKLIAYRKRGVRDEFADKYIEPSRDFMLEMKNIALENGVSDIVII